MTQSLANLLGKPGYGGSWDLDRQIESCKKATGSSSAIAAGRITVLTESTGLWAIGSSGARGRMGVVPALSPLNTDDMDTFPNITGIGASIYIEAGGTIEPGARVAPTTGGKGVQFSGDVTATPTQTTINSIVSAAPFIYEGHYGEGSGLDNEATQATTGQAIRVRIQPF